MIPIKPGTARRLGIHRPLRPLHVVIDQADIMPDEIWRSLYGSNVRILRRVLPWPDDTHPDYCEEWRP